MVTTNTVETETKPVTTYTVEIKHTEKEKDNEGKEIEKTKTYILQVPEDKHILEAASDEGLDLPNSCNAGVCATCAGKIIGTGSVDQEVMGLGTELQEEGYVLLCVAYPRSDLKIETGKEDEVCDRQYGTP